MIGHLLAPTTQLTWQDVLDFGLAALLTIRVGACGRRSALAEGSMITRAVTNSDVWAAIRGLGMARMSVLELEDLRIEHIDKEPFASRVIAIAALQMLATARRGGGFI